MFLLPVLILLAVALAQVGFFSFVSLAIYWAISRRRPSKKQIMHCAVTIMLLNIMMLVGAFITGSLEATQPQWFFFAYCAVLIAAGALVIKVSETKQSRV